MKLPFHYSDAGGTDAGFGDERDDCVVRAFVEATGIPYATAHPLFGKNGRRPRHGCMAGKLIPEVAKLCGVRFDLIVDREKYVTAGDILDGHPEGVLIIQIPSHAYAVKNGVVYDMAEQSSGAKVRRVWRVVSEPAC